MLKYTAPRLIMIPTLIVIGFITFVIIQLPPGDFLSNQIAELQSQGDKAAAEKPSSCASSTGSTSPSSSSTRSGSASGRARTASRAAPGRPRLVVQRPAGEGRGRRSPVPVVHPQLLGDPLHLGGRVPIGFYSPPASTAGATTGSPSSATSASRRRTSCSRSCSCTCERCSSTSRSAASWIPSTSASLELRQGALGDRHLWIPGRDRHLRHRR